MCGIVGFAGRDQIPNRDQLAAMLDTLSHRGPDDQGIWWDDQGRVGLGHRRLSVIDLSPAGHQPMKMHNGKTWIVFNGEIYNFKLVAEELKARGHIFQSASDTEVILEAYRAWGLDCLSYLNGMFAFALFDKQKNLLFLARDRAGEKPLFYFHTRNGLIFCSELKALMAYPDFSRRLDPEAFQFFLAYGYVPEDRCILAGVKKLPPAHCLTYDLNQDEVTVRRYWNLPQTKSQGFLPEEELLHQLEGLLTDAVQLRMIADVPLGILLSGGLDSSLITALAAKSSARPVKTFTMIFPGHGHYDEGPFAKQIAEYFNTDHNELSVTPEIVEILPDLACQFDEPIADSSIVPVYYISRLVRSHVTVALGGDGGDELFGGYEYYSFIQRLHALRKRLPGPFRQGIRHFSQHFLPVGTKGRNHLIALGGNFKLGVANINMYFDQKYRKQLLLPEVYALSNVHAPEDHKMSLCRSDASLFQNATIVDFLGIMPEAYLVKVDRASMLVSLEMRAPLLDHRLIEFAFKEVPDHLRATSSQRKILLGRLARKMLPPSYNFQRKQGFSLPLEHWFYGAWGNYVKEVLHEADPHLFRQSAIQGLIQGQLRGRANSQRLFALTIFELWRRHYKVTL